MQGALRTTGLSVSPTAIRLRFQRTPLALADEMPLEAPPPQQNRAIFSQSTLFASGARVTAALTQALHSSGPGGSDGDGDDSNLPSLRMTRILFDPQHPPAADTPWFDPALIATAYRRLHRHVTDVVVVRGEELIKNRFLRERIASFEERNADQRFVAFVSIAGRGAHDLMPLQKKEGLPVIHLARPTRERSTVAQYLLYQTGGPPIFLIWNDEERPHRRVLGGELTQIELSELKTFLVRTHRAIGSPQQAMVLGYLESHLLKMEVLSHYHPGRFRPEFFDRLWQFVYLVKAMGSIQVAGKIPSSIQEVYQLLSSEIGAALSAF